MTTLFSCDSLPSAKTVLSVVASLTASAVLFRTIADDLIPDFIHGYFSSRLRKLSNRYSSQLTVVIEEFEGLTSNHMFESANVYLGSKLSPSTARIKVNKPEKVEELTVTVDKNQEISDFYGGVKFQWVFQSTSIKQSGKGNVISNSRSELRFFELSFHKKHKGMPLKTYLPYVLQKAKAKKEETKAVRLHTVDYNGTDYWSSVILNHPVTFETMAMDSEAKRELIEDLDMFINRKDYYRRVGNVGIFYIGLPLINS